jgi:hypothetical protein
MTNLESVKRTIEERNSFALSRPFHGLKLIQVAFPSTKVLGYFQSSAAPTRRSGATTALLTETKRSGLAQFRVQAPACAFFAA